MKKYNLLQLFTILFCLSSTMCFSQKVETVKLEVEKEIPNASFSQNSFAVEFWVQAENFSSVVTDQTELLSLKDDTGKDLIKEHEEAVAVIQRTTDSLEKLGKYRTVGTTPLINPGSWEVLGPTLGIRARISSSMVRPSVNAKRVRAKLKITYTTEATATKNDSIRVTTIPSPADNPTFVYKGKEVPLKRGTTATLDDSTYTIYSIPKGFLDVSVTTINAYDANGNPIKGLKGLGHYEDEFIIEENLMKNPIDLVISFRPMETKTVTIDKWIGIGLSPD